MVEQFALRAQGEQERERETISQQHGDEQR